MEGRGPHKEHEGLKKTRSRKKKKRKTKTKEKQTNIKNTKKWALPSSLAGVARMLRYSS